MSSIFLPDRQIVQPQGAAALVATDGSWQPEFVHAFSSIADLSGNGYTLQLGTSVSFEAYIRGIHAYITSHSAGTAANIAISRGFSVAASDPFFSVVQYRGDSGGDNSGGLLCLRNTSANPICSMFVGSNGVAGAAGNATFIVRDNAGSLTRHETTTAVNDGLMHTSAVRRFNGRWQWSLDGSAWSDFGTTPTNAQGAITFTSDRMFYGREPTGTGIGNIFQGYFEFGMVGRGTLHDAQIAAVHQNPWQLFRASPRRLYFDVPAAGGGATAPGATITANASVIAGSATGNASAAGNTITANASVIAGGASAGVAGTAPGATLTATASIISGGASGVRNETALGALITATVSFFAGGAEAFIPGTGGAWIPTIFRRRRR